MTLVSGPLSTVTTTPSAVSQVNVSINSPRTRGTGLMTPEVKTVAVTGGDFSSQIAPGPAVLTLLIGGRESAPIPIVVPDAESATLESVIQAAEIADTAQRDILEEIAAQVTADREAVAADRQAVAQDKASVSALTDRAETAAGDAAIRAGLAEEKAGIATEASGKASASEQAAAQSASDAEADRASTEEARTRAVQAENTATGAATTATNKATEANLAADRAEAATAGKADLVGGKVPTSQIPEVALTKPFSVTSRAALLALDAQEGDIGIIIAGADKGSYMLGTGPANVFSSWVQLAVSADAPVQSVNGQTGTVVLNAANVGAAPTTHTHTSVQISDATASVTAGTIVRRDSNGRIAVSDPTYAFNPTTKEYVDSRIPALLRQEVTGTNGVTIFEKRGNVVHVASTGTEAGVTIPTDFRPTQARRVVVSTSATGVGICTINANGTISGAWAANAAFSYLAQ